MEFSSVDLVGASPILALSIVALLALLLKAFLKKAETVVAIVTSIGMIAGIIFAIMIYDRSTTAFYDMLLVGGYASFFDVLFSLLGLFTIILSYPYIQKFDIDHGEFYILILLSVLGMMMMASAADLVMVFMGLELMSVAFYILVGFKRTTEASMEASLKYFLLGAFATGFFLYGIALIYGTSGTTNLIRIAAQYPFLASNAWHVIGFSMLLIGFGFKVAAAPFHMWVPDVYQGAPTTITGLMSTAGKAAAFSAFLLTFTIPMSAQYQNFTTVIAVLAAASMIVGNVFGLAQTNVKRMLAYSSITHAGYLLIAISAGQVLGEQGLLFYLVAYGLTNIGAFGILAILEQEDGQFTTYEHFAGLGERRPLIAALMSIFMFSLVGLPPFAGFVGKYYLFASAVQSNLTWLAILGVVTSLISTYYYLRIVVYMYFKGPEASEAIELPRFSAATIIFCAVGVLILGIIPSLIIDIIRSFF